MVLRFKTEAEGRRQHLSKALDTFLEPPVSSDTLKRRIQLAKTSWLVAGLVEELAKRYPPPSPPEEFNVISTDGSHIDVDRHRQARCYLINIGSVMLHYGAEAAAVLSSTPRLYSEDEELVITPPKEKAQEQPVEGALLGIKRGVEECRALARLAAELRDRSPTLALLDGSLILWGLSGKAYPGFVTEALLGEGFLKYLDDIKKLNNSRRLALASYISFPRSSDVVNTLRLAICPYDPPDCDRHCKLKEARECDAISGVQDRELF